MVFATEQILYDSLAWQVASFVFFSTLCSYNMQRLIRYGSEQDEVSSPRMLWFTARRKLISTITLLSGGVSVVFFYFLATPEAKFISVFLGFVAIGYAVRFLPGQPRRSLRDVPGLKILLIGFSWAFVTVVLPALGREGIVALDTMKVPLLALERLFFIVAITIPFDIRDLKYDAANKKTIPQRIGVAKSKALSIILLCLAGLMSLWIWQVGLTPVSVLVGTMACYGISAALVVASSETRGEYFYAAGVDGLLLLYFVMILAGTFT